MLDVRMIRITAAGLACLVALPAQGQDAIDTTFDFSAPAPGQTGVYAASAGAELQGGSARFSTRPGWPARAQEVRVRVVLDHEGATTADAVVFVPAATLPTAFLTAARVDGTDVLVADDLGGRTDDGRAAHSAAASTS